LVFPAAFIFLLRPGPPLIKAGLMTTPVPSIDQIQPDAYYKLLSESVFAPIVVFKENPLRVSAEIDERLSNVTGDSRQGVLKKPGAAIVVKTPTFANVNSEAPGPLAEVRLMVVVKENPKINIEAKDANGNSTGTGITGLKWAQNVWQALHKFTFQGTCQTLYAFAITPNNEFEHLNLWASNVTFGATFPLQAPLFVFTPQDDIIGTTVTFTPTPPPQGSTNPQPASIQIFYTTDGSFPGAGNPTAVIYSKPVTVPHGTVVRWAGYAPGYNGSDAGWGYAE
jgi:hypothetical protein